LFESKLREAKHFGNSTYRNGCAPLRNLSLVMVHSDKSPKRADIKVG